ncbi:hypothetical protein HPB51_003477 [Rhipicephalus microplus]|uniref:Uncharacterized protein n=1 Tax=Rhipicephalus microplus TaxID=6941 RepID=A0A9J6EFJ2_RHIMP|nr:hypothetical protein HPB51_003477 [Rhipicephalus microplus]
MAAVMLSQEWQAQLFRDLPEDGVEIAGDGQCDSPGYSVKYCSYIVLAMEVGEILYYEQIRVGEPMSDSYSRMSPKAAMFQ